MPAGGGTGCGVGVEEEAPGAAGWPEGTEEGAGGVNPVGPGALAGTDPGTKATEASWDK